MNIKVITYLSCTLFIFSMIPNWLLAFIARPSGDDYGYASATRQIWLKTNSIVDVIKTGIQTTKSMYEVWNGDWFSVFIFTLMPEVFVTKSFWIVPIFWSLATIFTTYLFFDELLYHYLDFKKYQVLFITSIVLILCYQWIPSSAIGLYWYVGVIHYIMPHVLALLSISCVLKFLRTSLKIYIPIIILCMIAIGGSSYYSFFLAFLSYILILFCFRNSLDKYKVYWFIPPIFMGLIALYYQISSPGNKARVGNTISLNGNKVLNTIWESYIESIKRIYEYLNTKEIIFLLLFLIAIITFYFLIDNKTIYKFNNPLLFISYLYGIYAVMFTPEIYTKIEISGGPPTMVYISFILITVISIIYLDGWIIRILKQSTHFKKIIFYKNYIPITGIFICLFLLFCFKSNIKETLFWESVEYIVSGQASDYKKQMDSQLEILIDDSIKEVYLCPTNPIQGPLMHMPVIDDPKAFTNQVIKDFYGKDFVIAYP